MFCPTPWCQAPFPCSSGNIVVGAVILVVVMGLLQQVSALGVLCQKDYDVHVDTFVFLALRSTWVPFNKFANAFYTFPLSPLSCSSASPLNSPRTAPLEYATYCFFGVFVILEPVLSSSSSPFLWLWEIHHWGVSSVQPVPHLFLPRASIPLLHRSQGLRHCTSPVFLYTALCH